MAKRPKEQSLTINKSVDKSLQSKRKPQKVREDDKDAARVRNRIEKIKEQREFEKEFDL